MDSIFVVLSCDIEGSARDPACPRIVTPLLILDAIILDCSVLEMDTVPPEVYPAGIVIDPAFVLIVPPVLPLFAMLPLIDPDELNALLPDRISPAAASAPAVS